MAAEYVLACNEADFSADTGTCSAAYYIPAPVGWPALSYADAGLLGSKIVMLFALAWCLRKLRQIQV